MNKRFVQYGAAFAIVQLLTACGEGTSAPPPQKVEQTAAPQAHAEANDKLIVTFGDSLFAGYQLDAGQGMAHGHVRLGKGHLLFGEDIAVLQTDIVFLVEETLLLNTCHVKNIKLRNSILQTFYF